MKNNFDIYYIKCGFCGKQDLRSRCAIVYWDKKEYHAHCFTKKLIHTLNELPKEHKKIFNEFWEIYNKE